MTIAYQYPHTAHMDNFAKARAASGDTQLVAARKLRISQSTVSLLEKGGMTPSLELAICIDQVYGVRIPTRRELANKTLAPIRDGAP